MNEGRCVNRLHGMVDRVVDSVKGMGREAEAFDSSSGIGQVERFVFSELLNIGKAMLEAYVAELGNGDEGFRIEADGHVYTRQVERPVSVLTVFGKVAVPRCVYYARGHGRVSPTDASANLPDRQASYFVQKLLGRLGTESSYEEAVDFFEDLFGISVSTHTADDIVADMSVYHNMYNKQVVLPQGDSEGELQVISFDCKGVPMIKPQEAKRAGRLGKGQKRNKKKMAMVGVEYTINRNVRDARSVAQSLATPERLSHEQKQALADRDRARNTHYEASVLNKESVLTSMRERVDRKAVITQRDLVCLIDGDPHLATLVKSHFPDATVILDIIHAVEYLWKAAHAIHGEGSCEATKMVNTMLEKVLKGRVGHVIGGLRQRSAGGKLSATKQKTVTSVIGYLENHRQYMHYDQYLANGYPIGTGVVESACGHLVKNRMERPGARWSLDGAEAMLRLRAMRASGHWNTYTEFREKQEFHRLYKPLQVA